MPTEHWGLLLLRRGQGRMPPPPIIPSRVPAPPIRPAWAHLLHPFAASPCPPAPPQAPSLLPPIGRLRFRFHPSSPPPAPRLGLGLARPPPAAPPRHRLAVAPPRLALPRRRAQTQAPATAIQGTEEVAAVVGVARRLRQDGRWGDGGRAGRRRRRGGHQQQGRLRAREEDHPQERPLPRLPEQAPHPANRRRAQLPPGSLTLRLPPFDGGLSALRNTSRVSERFTSRHLSPDGWDGIGGAESVVTPLSHAAGKLLQSPAPPALSALAKRNDLLALFVSTSRMIPWRC